MKKLTYTTGNLLFNPRVEVVGHQANCQNTFGAGIARSIKEVYEEAYLIDTISAAKKKNVLGSFSAARIPLVDGRLNRHGNKIHTIYNLYGQNLGTDHTKKLFRKTNYEALYSALEAMASTLSEYDGDHPAPVVGFPFLMGCGLGGGNWNIVERLIEVAFESYESDVIIVKFE